MIEALRAIRSELKRINRRMTKKSGGKIFCLSYQRTGTTSVGRFFKEHGYHVANYQVNRARGWSEAWFDGDFDRIFRDREFVSHQVFEDNPWFFPEFYKVLFNRFPDARFVLFERDPEDWFASMLRHSQGLSLGNSMRHAKVYRREWELYNFLEANNLSTNSTDVDNLLDMSGKKDQYISQYTLHNHEVKRFFQQKGAQSRLFTCRLEDDEKWKKLGKFMGIKVASEYEVHMNESRSLAQ